MVVSSKDVAQANFVHRENLALFKKRLAEAHDATHHKLLLKLLAEELAKELPQKMEK